MKNRLWKKLIAALCLVSILSLQGGLMGTYAGDPLISETEIVEMTDMDHHFETDTKDSLPGETDTEDSLPDEAMAEDIPSGESETESTLPGESETEYGETDDSVPDSTAHEETDHDNDMEGEEVYSLNLQDADFGSSMVLTKRIESSSGLWIYGELNGITAYCIEHENVPPDLGAQYTMLSKISCETVSLTNREGVSVDPQLIRKIMYFGFEGPGQITGSALETTHAISVAFGHDDGTGNDGQAFISRLDGYSSSDIPKSFTVYLYAPDVTHSPESGNPYQVLALWQYDTWQMHLTLNKSSQLPTVTDGMAAYSLYGAVYGLYTDAACTSVYGYFVTDAKGNSVLRQRDAASAPEKTVDFENGISSRTFYLKELTASAGYRLDPTVYQLTLTADPSVQMKNNSSGAAASYNGASGYAEIKVKEVPAGAVLNIVKASTDETWTEGKEAYSLAGAEFEVYYVDSVAYAVRNLYSTALGRSVDASGYQSMTNRLRQGETYAKICYDILASGEYKNQKVCYRHYMTMLYYLLLGRGPDRGIETWVTQLQNGTYTAAQQFDRLASSAESRNWTSKLGITVGSMAALGHSTATFGTSAADTECSFCGDKKMSFTGLSSAEKTLVGLVTTDASGYAGYEGPLGIYFVREVKAPANYALDSTSFVQMTASTAETASQSTTFTDSPLIYIKVHKVWEDAEDVRGQRPKTLKISLHRRIQGDSSSEGVQVGDGELSAANNWQHIFENLPRKSASGELYDYYITEELPEGYEQSGTTEVVLAEDGAGYEMTIRNRIKERPFELVIRKLAIDPVTISTAGTVFKISYFDEASGVSDRERAQAAVPTRVWYIQTNAVDKSESTASLSLNDLVNDENYQSDVLYTTEDGEITIPAGALLIEEACAAPGYTLGGRIYQAELGDIQGTGEDYFMTISESNASLILEAVDPSRPCRISISKTDEGGIALSGAAFALYSGAGEEIGAGITDAQGSVSFEDLPAGDYYIVETETSLGYSLLTEPIRFTLPMQIAASELPSDQRLRQDLVYDAYEDVYFAFELSYSVRNGRKLDMPYSGNTAGDRRNNLLIPAAGALCLLMGAYYVFAVYSKKKTQK